MFILSTVYNVALLIDMYYRTFCEKERDMTDGVVTSELRSFVDRLVRLAENKKAIAEDEKTVCSEAKDKGYDLPALKQVVKEQLMDEKQLDAANEQTEMVALYREKLGS